MIEVKKSKCQCGKCKKEFLVEWELEILDSTERPLGEEVQYISEIAYECPECGNVISAVLQAIEYPVGALELVEIQKVWDSEDTYESRIEEPFIMFFDL